MIILISRAYWRRLVLLIGALTLLTIYFAGKQVIHVIAPIGLATVIIDPGHGGVDGGCSGGDLQEKDVNLQLGLAITEALKQSGITTGITRTEDVPLEPFGRPGRHRRDLMKRVQIIEQSHAKAYASIHCDWSHDKSRQGPAVFYCYRSEESKKLAIAIQQETNTLLGFEQKAEPGDYLILKAPAAPGALVEAGFLSNATDRQHLSDPEYRAKLASAIARGILRYLNRSEPTEKSNN